MDDRLAVEVVGAGPRLVLAHGFTQNGACWGRLAEMLAESYEVVLVDLPGHGRSEHDDADLWQAAELLAEVGGEATYVGYSMGGRVAIHLALARPELMSGLVLIGATAGIESHSGRAERVAADNALAVRLTSIGLESFLDEWLAKPLFAGLDGEGAAREQRLMNRTEGLAASLRHCGSGTQDPLWDRLGEIECPTLVVAGEADLKFSELGQRLASSIGTNAEFSTIPGTHPVHLEQPAQMAALISASTLDWRTE